MSRDRFVKIEWGDKAANTQREFGHCDNGFKLDTREEAEVYAELKQQGYTVRKHGWPDFLAENAYGVRLIEVKSSADRLRETQHQTHQSLARIGVDVEVIVRENPNRPQRYHLGVLKKKKKSSRVVVKGR